MFEPAAGRSADGTSRRVLRGSQITVLIGVLLPFVAFVVGVVLWDRLVGGAELAIMGVTYLLTTLGVTIGFHRLLTHRAFETHPPIRAALAVLGSMAFQNPPIIWVSDHRQHHAHADEEGDPHSPHLEGEETWRAAVRGLWHAHMGWLFKAQGQSQPLRYATDLVRDRSMRRISAWFIPIVAAGLVIPFFAGWAVTGSLERGLTTMFWAGPVRIFLQSHITWSINSVCHYFGARPYATRDRSTNVAWLALPSLGEAWHNNHHAHPRAAMHGARWWELDISGLLIRALERLGLAWNLVERPPHGDSRAPVSNAKGVR